MKEGWRKHRSVLRALFLREMKARFTSAQGGLFWTFFEPFFIVSIFLGLHIFLRGSSGDAESTKEAFMFLMLSVTSFFLFRSILNGSAGAFKANHTLFVYRYVKPIDTILARVLVESFIMGIVIIIFILISLYFGVDLNPKNLAMVGLGYIWLTIFGISLGILVAVGNSFYDFIGKIVRFLSLPLLFLSAIFYSVESIYQKSPELAELLLYNPIVHFMEMIHGNYFYNMDDRFVDYRYMFLWTATTLFTALWLYIMLERKIVSTS